MIIEPAILTSLAQRVSTMSRGLTAQKLEVDGSMALHDPILRANNNNNNNWLFNH